MTLEIIEVNGEYGIFESQPVLIGVFPDRANAERVLQLLAAGADEAKTLAPTTPAAPKPDTKPHAPKAPAATLAPKPASSGAALETWTEDELETAIARLVAGEKLKDVAADMGKNWVSLRSKWANAKRHGAVAGKTSAPPQTQPAEEDMEECRLCGKAFRPSLERMDLCKACDNDA